MQWLDFMSLFMFDLSLLHLFFLECLLLFRHCWFDGLIVMDHFLGRISDHYTWITSSGLKSVDRTDFLLNCDLLELYFLAILAFNNSRLFSREYIIWIEWEAFANLLLSTGDSVNDLVVEVCLMVTRQHIFDVTDLLLVLRVN